MRPNPASSIVTRLVLLFCLLSLAACGGKSDNAMNRSVTLADIQVQEMRTLETTFLIGLRILNPGEQPLTIQGISCDLRIDDRHFASGLTGKQQQIPPYGTAIIQVPVYASTLDMITSVLQRLQKAQQPDAEVAPISYELNGHLLVQQGENGAAGKIPFEAQGDLTFAGSEKKAV